MWQYTYRNEKYRKLRSIFKDARPDNSTQKFKFSLSGNKEYELISNYEFINLDIPDARRAKYEQTIVKTLKKFNCYPAWPINGYTSDFILQRMLSGEFQYWERETPPFNLSQEKQFHLCLRDATTCTNEKRIVETATDGEFRFIACAPECLISMHNKEMETYQKTINKEHRRIRSEGIHRMIGLWLWDYCNGGRKATYAEAVKALKERHFPVDNPGWSSKAIGGLKVQKEDKDWYDFMLETTLETTLDANFKDACNCITQAKFLPLSRGGKRKKRIVA